MCTQGEKLKLPTLRHLRYSAAKNYDHNIKNDIRIFLPLVILGARTSRRSVLFSAEGQRRAVTLYLRCYLWRRFAANVSVGQGRQR